MNFPTGVRCLAAATFIDCSLSTNSTFLCCCSGRIALSPVVLCGTVTWRPCAVDEQRERGTVTWPVVRLYLSVLPLCYTFALLCTVTSTHQQCTSLPSLSTTSRCAVDEQRERGTVTWPVVRLYLSMLGGPLWYTLALLFTVAVSAADIGSVVWLGVWASQSLGPGSLRFYVGIYTALVVGESLISGGRVLVLASAAVRSHSLSLSLPLSLFLPPALCSLIFALCSLLSVFPACCASQLLCSVLSLGLLRILCLHSRCVNTECSVVTGAHGSRAAQPPPRRAAASTQNVPWLQVRAAVALHSRLLTALLRLPTSFFDVHPSGRVVSRFTSDTSTLDFALPHDIDSLVTSVFSLLSVFATIALGSPAILLAVPPLLFIYAALQVCTVCWPSCSSFLSHSVPAVLSCSSLLSHSVPVIVLLVQLQRRDAALTNNQPPDQRQRPDQS